MGVTSCRSLPHGSEQLPIHGTRFEFVRGSVFTNYLQFSLGCIFVLGYLPQRLRNPSAEEINKRLQAMTFISKERDLFVVRQVPESVLPSEGSDEPQSEIQPSIPS